MHSAEKTKVASYCKNNKLGVSFKMGYDESRLSILRTYLRFYSALAILEPQNYVVIEQLGGKYLAAQRASCSKVIQTVYFLKFTSSQN